MASPFNALKHRNYRLFWFGQAVSLIGTWMQSTGQSWLVLMLTDSPFLLGLVSALQLAPVLAFALFAGVLADRLPKRRLLVATQGTMMVLAFLLSALTLLGWVRYWHVAVLAALLGAANAFDIPIRQSFMVEIVGRGDLTNAIALNATIFNVARFIGPAIAGFVTKELGPGWAFFANGVSFLGVIAALLAMDVKAPRIEKARGGVLAQVREGLGYIVREPRVSTCLVMLGLISTFSLNFSVLVPLLARDVLHGDAGLYGILMSAVGLGALIGATGMTIISGGGPRRWMMNAGAAMTGLSCLALAFIRGSLLATAALTLAGLAWIVFYTQSLSTVQVTVPDRLRGRVLSVHSLVFNGVPLFGSLFAGSVAQSFGTPASFGAGGVAGTLSALGVILWWRRAVRNGAATQGPVAGAAGGGND
ncbi:MAG TPA: MFS transporter [Bacillota bacterium]